MVKVDVAEIIRAIKEDEYTKLAILGYLGVNEIFSKLDAALSGGEEVGDLKENLSEVLKVLKSIEKILSEGFENIQKEIRDFKEKVLEEFISLR